MRREPPAETLSMERVWGNSAQFAAVGSSPRGEGKIELRASQRTLGYCDMAIRTTKRAREMREKMPVTFAFFFPSVFTKKGTYV